MKDGRKKIWICLLVVVLAAVVLGVLYYLSAPNEQASEGFLIRTGLWENVGTDKMADAKEEEYGI